jgi:hypothetical protein
METTRNISESRDANRVVADCRTLVGEVEAGRMTAGDFDSITATIRHYADRLGVETPQMAALIAQSYGCYVTFDPSVEIPERS